MKKIFNIREFNTYPDESMFKINKGEDIRIKMIIDKSCKYNESNVANSLSLNRLFGFSYGFPSINSVNIMWIPNYEADSALLYVKTYTDGEVNLSYFGYVNYNQEFKISFLRDKNEEEESARQYNIILTTTDDFTGKKVDLVFNKTAIVEASYGIGLYLSPKISKDNHAPRNMKIYLETE